MEVMQPRKKGQSWNDNAVVEPSAAPQDAKKSKAKAKTTAPASDEEELSSPPGQDAASDMDWLKQHMKSSLELETPAKETVFDQSDDEDHAAGSSSVVVTATTPNPAEEAKATILQSGRLFLRNLSFSCTDEELQAHFEPFGQIAQVSFSFSFRGGLPPSS